MKNLTDRILIFCLAASTWTLITGCQAQTGAGSTPSVEVTATPISPVEAPAQPPSPASDAQAEISPPHNLDNSSSAEKADVLDKVKSEKLSGIVYYPPRKTLFAVSDNGRILEIKTDGTFVQNKQVRHKADFEGITYSPTTEMLYVAIEGEEVILEVDPKTLKPERDIPIDRMFEGNMLLSPEDNGIEGITFVPAAGQATNDSFYLINQSNELGGTDPSIVFEVEIEQDTSKPQARIIRYFSVGLTDLSGIDYVPASRRLLIISDTHNLLLEVSLSGQVLETYLLPGKKQEGITMDEAGFLYIAQDTKESLFKLTSLDNVNNMDR